MAHRKKPWIIEDVSIGRRDDDQFDHVSVARELAHITRNSQESLAIGLLGRYGTGKSSVVRLLKDELSNNPRWKVLQVSAERHTGVARARGLLYGLLDEAKDQGLFKGDNDYAALRACLQGSQQQTAPRARSNVGEEDAPWKRVAKALRAGALWLLALSGLTWLLGAVVTWAAHRAGAWGTAKTLSWFTSSGAIAPAMFLLSAAVAAAVITAVKEAAQHVLRSYDITVNTPRADTTDELEQTFLKLIRVLDKRVVIAIDDIDRLAADDVLEALTTVRSLLLVGAQHAHPPVFLLSCDEDIVREAITGVSPGLAHAPSSEDSLSASETSPGVRRQAAGEYLNKLFTVRIALPTHHDLDMREYAQKLLRKDSDHDVVKELGGWATTEAVLDVLIHEQVGDPRHVIRLLNGFLTDYRLAQRREATSGPAHARIAPGEVTNYPIELARLTVLRYDFRELYDEVRKEPELLHLLDDATLSNTAAAWNDPLTVRFILPTAPPQLDYDKHPGLAYVRTTAYQLRPYRAPYLGPLLAMGSSPDSRFLGSQMARDIRSELTSRDIDGFAERLGDANTLERVLQAAQLTVLGARSGQARDNAIRTATRALSRQPATFTGIQRLADHLAGRRRTMTQALEPADLAALLRLTSSPYHPELIDELAEMPDDAESRWAWADSLLGLAQSEHAPSFEASLHDYFVQLGVRGDANEIKHWSEVWRSDTQHARQALPVRAYAALLSMTARCQHEPEVDTLRTIIDAAEEQHQWNREIAEGLLECLIGTSPLIRRAAIHLLHRAPVPDNGWGPARDAENSAATLLAELTMATAKVLTEEEDDQAAMNAAGLLRAWLPTVHDHSTPTEEGTGAHVIARAIADNADTALELAEGAEGFFEDFSAPAAAAYSRMLAEKVGGDPSDNEIDAALRAALVRYVRGASEDPDSETAGSLQISFTQLTSSLGTDSSAGRAARQGLAALMSTDYGQDRAAELAPQLISALPVPAAGPYEECLAGLHVLFASIAARDQHLPSTLQRLAQWFNYNNAQHAAAGFAACYADQAAVTDNWLAWIGQYWDGISDTNKARAFQAAARTDLLTPGGNQFVAVLLKHLTHATSELVWAWAPVLWDRLTGEQRAQLLAHERGQCPDLAQRAEEADINLLLSAVLATGDHPQALFKLLQGAPAFSETLTLFMDELLNRTQWEADLARDTVCACPDPAGLWATAVEQAYLGQEPLARAADIIRYLAESHPGTVPDELADRLTPLVLEGGPQTAQTVGAALKLLTLQANGVSRKLGGKNNISNLEKERTKAFRRAAGLIRS
ncbi:P-loop NTPase fold protein [Streptomyces sp. NPDC056982]|uniref:P-loop NTPase fold protein n=1 Tax=Streptomyces sp. NPDC056982 TaxID=3345986 RepID=UPI003637B2E9